VFKPYKYIKEEPSLKRVEEPSKKIVIRLPKPKIHFRKWASVALIAGGIFLITDQIVLPWLVTPLPQKPLLKPTLPSVAGAHSKIEVGFEFTELRRSPESGLESGVVEVEDVFYVSIPKLGIERAEVDTNSESLSPDERLGHYPGSALPGEVGNTFIYGHSVLPMFFNPEDYKTIFSTLDTLEEGDEFTVEFGEKSFLYMVEKAIVLRPEDVHPLEPVAPPSLQQSYLTLMTCVPPGVRTNRLLVQAKLIL